MLLLRSLILLSIAVPPCVLAQTQSNEHSLYVDEHGVPQHTAQGHNVSVSSGVMQGLLVKKTPLRYPDRAKADRVSGAVVLHVTVGKNGHVENASVISGPELLRAAAVESVRGWEYRPYQLNGEAIVVETTVTVTFMLSD